MLIAVDAAAITFDELTWPETWASGGVDRTPVIPSHEFSGSWSRSATVSPGCRLVTRCSGWSRSTGTAPRRSPSSCRYPGQRVLVHGGAGGVGSFVTQTGDRAGASVTWTVHGRDVGYVLALGAERVINTDQESLDAEPGVFDVVIDVVGQDTPEGLFAALRRGGRLVTLQQPPSQETADKHGVTALFFIVTAERDRLARLADMIDIGKLEVSVAATFPLAECRAAYESGAVRRPRPGKTVLVVYY